MEKAQELEKIRYMQNYIAEVLHSTGEFESIDPRYEFSLESSASALRELPERQIMCKIKTGYVTDKEGREFLILTHPNTMTGHVFAKKMEEASKKGIYTVNVLYRYINSKDPSTQGPLFRRFVLEEDRKKGEVAYRKKAAFSRGSLTHYSHEKVNRFRFLRNIERSWVNYVSGGFLLYYQPNSKRLEETLKRYKFDDVIFKGKDNFGNYRETKSVEIKDPNLVESMGLFTIQPNRRNLNQLRILYGLQHNIKENGKPFRFDSELGNNLLLADIVNLPNIEAETDIERKVRHNVGLLGYAIQFGLGEDAIYELTERIGIQVGGWREGNPLVDITEKLLKENTENRKRNHQKDGGEIWVPSETNPEKEYRVILKDEDYVYCSCPSFKFSKGPDKDCKHLKKLRKSDEFNPDE